MPGSKEIFPRGITLEECFTVASQDADCKGNMYNSAWGGYMQLSMRKVGTSRCFCDTVENCDDFTATFSWERWEAPMLICPADGSGDPVDGSGANAGRRLTVHLLGTVADRDSVEDR